MLRWLCIKAVAALFSYFGFRANVWKVHIFNGNADGTMNSQSAVFLSLSHNESSRGKKNVFSEGGVGSEKEVWVFVVFGVIREGCKCTVHGRPFGKSVYENCSPACAPRFPKNKPASKNAVPDACRLFPSVIQSSSVWIFSRKMAPSSITHYKPHDSFHCARVSPTRLR